MEGLDPTHVEWCRRMFALLREGGVWGIPRSGMVWMKRDGKLVLTARMPWMPEMKGVITPEELNEQQDEEYEANRLHFEAAGITVEDSTRA